GVAAPGETLLGDRRWPERAQLLGEPVEVPLVSSRAGAVRLEQGVDRLVEVLDRRRLEVGALEDLVTARVDDLALLVHHFVVLEDVLADLGVARLDRRLRP